MAFTRVLMVDDSAVTRRLIARALAKCTQIEIASTAVSGEQALAQLPHVAADVVLLDVEMNGMSGIETLIKIKKSHPQVKVLMFSALTEQGAKTTLEAMAAGASDYVAKPSRESGKSIDEVVSAAVVPRILALTEPESSTKLKSVNIRVAPPVTGDAPLQIVALAASTGGPVAIEAILSALPADFPLPVLVVQHMPPVFTTAFAQRMAKVCRLPVREATGGERLDSPGVWIAPGGSHLAVGHGGALKLTTAAAENAVRPSADVLFRSVAQAYGRGVLAVVLTGLGQDGARGAEAIIAAGGTVITQDQATSAVWAMPRAVIDAGASHGTYSLSEITAEIVRRTGKRRAGQPPAADAKVARR